MKRSLVIMLILLLSQVSLVQAGPNEVYVSWTFKIIGDTKAPTVGMYPVDGSENVPQDVVLVAQATDTQSEIDIESAVITVNSKVIPLSELLIDATNPMSVKFMYAPDGGFGLGETITATARIKDKAL